MPVTYDLHTHSTASDGTLAPGELVARAARAGIRVLALTDHDTTEGLTEARRAAEASGISLIDGIEISTTWESQVVHVVGLGIDPGAPALQEGLAVLRRFREWRAGEIGRRLQRAGIGGAYEGAKALSNGRLISRTHFARFLVAAGHAADTKKVFKRFLTRGKPGHVPGKWAELDAAVGWVLEAGGQAAIAHPARYPFTRTKLRRLIGEFRECGGEAIEVVSGSHGRDDALLMGRYATEFQLMASVGSDYHGPETPWLELGNLSALPDGCVPIWHNWPFEKISLSA